VVFGVARKLHVYVFKVGESEVKGRIVAVMGVGAVLALLAAGSAWGINSLIGWWVAAPDLGLAITEVDESQDRNETAKEPLKTSKRSMDKRSLIDGILRRNIFDSTAIGVLAEAPTGLDGEGEITDLKLRLLATIVAEPVAYSSALIAPDERDAAGTGYGIGQEVSEGAVIVAIEKKRVVLERNGKREYLLFDDKDAPKSTAGSSKPKGGDDEDGISDMGDNKFVIPRETLDKYLGDLDALAKMGRARPNRDENRKIDGYRLSGIRRNSLGSKLGIKTGDVVHSVNGRPLTSMGEAMEAWQSLQSEGRFTFDITRRGQRQTMEYEVR